MRWNSPLFWLLAGLLYTSNATAEVPSSGQVNQQPTPDSFSVCHGYGCREVTQVGLTTNEWQEIRQLMQPAAENAEQERRSISRAIARFERIVGRKTGTSTDLALTFNASADLDQMDCIDESSNTRSYLLILQQQKLLRWHRVSDRATRGFFLFGWPHTTAVMDETGSGSQRWAVDSWFHDNGAEPEIVPLAQWKSGWEPK